MLETASGSVQGQRSPRLLPGAPNWSVFQQPAEAALPLVSTLQTVQPMGYSQPPQPMSLSQFQAWRGNSRSEAPTGLQGPSAQMQAASQNSMPPTEKARFLQVHDKEVMHQLSPHPQQPPRAPVESKNAILQQQVSQARLLQQQKRQRQLEQRQMQEQPQQQQQQPLVWLPQPATIAPAAPPEISGLRGEPSRQSSQLTVRMGDADGTLGNPESGSSTSVVQHGRQLAQQLFPALWANSTAGSYPANYPATSLRSYPEAYTQRVDPSQEFTTRQQELQAMTDMVSRMREQRDSHAKDMEILNERLTHLMLLMIAAVLMLLAIVSVYWCSKISNPIFACAIFGFLMFWHVYSL